MADKLEFKIVKGTQGGIGSGAAADPSLTKTIYQQERGKRLVYRILIRRCFISTITQIAPYVGNFYA